MTDQKTEIEKGTLGFRDIFRRADKNDDGALSWNEFQNFFADGVLSLEELQKLFNDIDTHNTNNIDIEELVSYFTQHLGPFKKILSVVEDLNASVSDALDKTSKSYPNAGFAEQYLTRFMLRETLNQLSAIQTPLDVASDTLDEQANQERVGVAQIKLDVDDNMQAFSVSNVLPGRVGRRMRKQFATQTSWTTESGQVGSPLEKQVDRLKTLLDKLERRVNFDGIIEEQIDVKDDKLLTVVHRRMRVLAEAEKAFRNNLRNYMAAASDDPACLNLSIRVMSGGGLFHLYEIWNSEDDWKSFLYSSAYKTFQHCKVDLLEVPENVNTVNIPDSWWNRE